MGQVVPAKGNHSRTKTVQQSRTSAFNGNFQPGVIARADIAYCLNHSKSQTGPHAQHKGFRGTTYTPNKECYCQRLDRLFNHRPDDCHDEKDEVEGREVATSRKGWITNALLEIGRLPSYQQDQKP